jgi:hypothetical protein
LINLTENFFNTFYDMLLTMLLVGKGDGGGVEEGFVGFTELGLTAGVGGLLEGGVGLFVGRGGIGFYEVF